MPAPKVINAINKPWPVTVEVHFDTVLLENEDLLEPGNYTFDHGAFTTSVTQIDEKQVRLTVENLFEFNSFTVTVSENIKSFTGESVDANNNSFTFTISRPFIDDSLQALSATNGRLKSGQSVVKVSEDADNWYLLTESGLDIVNKVSLMNEGYALDAYGFNAIFIG